MRFHPLAENWAGYDGNLLFNRETVWMDLSQESNYEQRVRTAIKKGSKTLSLELDSDGKSFDRFRELYYEGMRLIGAQQFYFFRESYFEALKAWDDVFCLFATIEGRTVAGAMFLCSDHYMEYHLSACLEEGRKVSATNLLLDEAAQIGRKKGIQAFHLGGGTSTDPQDKLLFFKSGFSPLRSRFFIGKQILDPLTYDRSKIDWIAKTGSVNNNILFYR